MPKREQFLGDLAGEDDYGILLLAQMDGVPDTMQCVVATTHHDEAAGGLIDKHRYVIRALGVQEHRLSVGMFKSARLLDDHPLLYEHNRPPAALFFRGQPDDAHALIVDIFQGYASTFGLWRQLPTYLNISKPLIDLVQGGGDLVARCLNPWPNSWRKPLKLTGPRRRSPRISRRSRRSRCCCSMSPTSWRPASALRCWARCRQVQNRLQQNGL
ncbi:hypothetical protein HC928_10125 [bacterium]|nr:hypothetical protein [bacterium]